MARMTGNEIALSQLAQDTALAVVDNGEDEGGVLAQALRVGHEMRISMGDSNPNEVYNPHFWVAEDEAPLFREMVRLALAGLRRGDDTYMIHRDRLFAAAQKRVAGTN